MAIPKKRIRRAKQMWADGASARDIAKSIGSTKAIVLKHARAHRDDFPSRREWSGGRPKAKEEAAAEVSPRPDFDLGRVKRVTLSGAVVTLPRVTFIDGPAA